MQNDCPPVARAEELRRAVQARYAAVSRKVEGQFPYPVGRESALKLGYDGKWLDIVPSETVDRFVGIGNPFRVRRPAEGEHVLDLGSGCGLDSYVAALLVGRTGRSAGIDLTPEMLEWPRRAVSSWALGNVEFLQADVEALPFEDETFDMAISNGTLNLVPDKDAAFREVCRVLKHGGILAAADLLVTEEIPEELSADMDAWST